uniref:Putative secreted protein n=1 Tax=Amblyomma cajennense TaxID=34607 RepID=A0A023FE56_AMBCJ
MVSMTVSWCVLHLTSNFPLALVCRLMWWSITHSDIGGSCAASRDVTTLVRGSLPRHGTCVIGARYWLCIKPEWHNGFGRSVQFSDCQRLNQSGWIEHPCLGCSVILRMCIAFGKAWISVARFVHWCSPKCLLGCDLPCPAFVI